ncbi:hypothetical protein WA026_008441 [Henosepilachna vigintioctopunctata]|uniref:Huntingtin n=1 Tax=Henosepilachna vigintioctopunctata TaxID=420089 RepID=A0AAW1UII3_9CUCU
MATQEKFLKSLELLKKLSYLNNDSELGNVKKEKIQHCHIITECICNNVLQATPNFLTMALSFAMEILFQLCDDSDSDVRMVVEECLNKIIRSLNNENITKVLIELHNEIKRNNSSRCLRAALTRFSKLVYYVRPQKGKPYVYNLFPSLINIIKRPEEIVHETLSNSLSSIIEVLGPFTTDNDVKNLLKSFMANISNPSAVIRRSTATSIQNMCLNCPKPYLSIVYCINIVLGFMFPLNENCDTHLILGVMSVLKLLLPQWSKLSKKSNIRKENRKVTAEWGELGVEKLLQIYELCIHYMNHKDHNFVISSIETLHILLENSTQSLRRVLLSPGGITKCSSQLLLPEKPKSISQFSLNASSIESLAVANFSECDLSDSIRPDISKWIDESKLTVFDMVETKSEKLLEESQSEGNKRSMMTRSLSHIDLGSSVEINFSLNIDKHFNGDDVQLSTHSSEKSLFHGSSPEIFMKDVYIGDFNDKDIPLKYVSRLLAKSYLLTGTPGYILSDHNCRISVKSSAMTCLSSILRIYPNILLEYLNKNVTIPQTEADQRMSDIVLFASHNDPQLRGTTRLLIAKYIVSVISENKGLYDRWLDDNSVERNDCLRLKNLLSIFISGLKDQSSLCVRHTLQSLEICLESVLESVHSEDTIPLLISLPDVYNNPYWLVKVNLCNLICSLPYITIHYVIENEQFQNKILHTMYELIKDTDVRVRKATSNAFLKLIPRLYFEAHMAENSVTAKVIAYRKLFLSNLFRKSWMTPFHFKPIINSLPFPFNKMSEAPLENSDVALSKIILDIHNIILCSNSKNTMLGCIETLASLSKAFPCTSYRTAWNCSILVENSDIDKKNDLLRFCVDLMYNSDLIYEINFHTNLLILCSSLYAGISMSMLRSLPENVIEQLNMFDSGIHSDISKDFLKHIVKILNIFQHIIDDLNFASSHAKSIIMSLPTASPLKRRKSDLEKKFTNTSKITEEKNEKKEKHMLGSFAHLPHYVRIYETLKTSYGNYKTSLEPSAAENFLDMLKTSLQCLSVLLEIGISPEFGIIAEEVLSYLNSTFRIEPSATIECVQQLLKSVFGTNLASGGMNIINALKESTEKVETTSKEFGFYYNIFLKPFNNLSTCINSLKDMNKRECIGDNTVMGYLHRNTHRNLILGRNLDKVLANYIRIFEPMVIKSLKQYTITSDVQLQVQVLQLLSQLVQLKINYCLLDADQIFINFVIKQFVYIEGGQIRHCEDLVRKIFQFLVQLSYSKQHSKSIINIPKILNLCDVLTASGQCPLTHCIPALEPVVEDIFLTRNALNSSDIKELETTREVILAMLLKLIEYYEVVELIILILDDSKYCCDTDKWLRWSREVLNSFMTSLKTNKYRLDNIDSLNAARKLIFSLNPQVMHDIDDMILLLFQEPPSLDEDVFYFTRWMGKIITILMILSAVKEDVILAKISSLKNNFIPNSVFENIVTTIDPLNVTNNADFFHGLSSEDILLRFVLRSVTLASKKCSLIVEEGENQDQFFMEELSIFLTICLYNFQSGFLRKAGKIAIHILETSKYASECHPLRLDPINANFRNLMFSHPTLILQWFYLLTFLGYKDKTFWSFMFHSSGKNEKMFYALNHQVVNVGCCIVLCDYLLEKENEDLFCFLENELYLLIQWSQEPPIKEFLSNIHGKVKLSKQLLRHFEQECIHPRNVHFKMKLLKSLENIHPSLIGDLVKLLVSKIIHIRDPSLIKEMSELLTKNLELILTMSVENVHKQLTNDDLIEMISILKNGNGCKHEALLGLLDKIKSKFHNCENPNNTTILIESDLVKNCNIDESWYISHVKTTISKANLGRELAEMLSILNYEIQMEILQNKCTNITVMRDCITYGLRVHENAKCKEIPSILRASIDCLFLDVHKIIEYFPEPCQLFNRFIECDQSEVLGKTKFNQKIHSVEICEIFLSSIPSISYYLQSISSLSSVEVKHEDPEIILKFSILALEFANYLTEKTKSPNIDIISYSIQNFNYILKHNSSFIILNSDAFHIWSCSAVTNVYDIVNRLLESSDATKILPNDIQEQIIRQFENQRIGEAGLYLYTLFSWFYSEKSAIDYIPSYLFTDFKDIIISLGRLSIFNPHMLIPPHVWKKGWDLNESSSLNPVPMLPVSLLQEIDILEDYIFRITLLGWTSRQQFEETWMCLLGVLCNVPTDGSTTEEINEIYACTTLSIKGITSMLLQTLYQPIPGKGNISDLTHITRNDTINCDRISLTKLKEIQLLVKSKYSELPNLSKKNEIVTLFDDINLEKRYNIYSVGEVSIKYLLIAVGIFENIEEQSLAYKIWNKRDVTLQKYGLDITSCLHFLQDFYSQLIQFQQINSLSVLHEIVSSILVLSDLFNDKSQFSWMLDLFFNLLKTHSVEEETLHKSLIIGACKAVAVLNPELEVYETLKKYLVHFLKSPYISTKVSCLHGFLYILEGCILSNISIGAISEELQLILPCAVEYVQMNLNQSNRHGPQYQEHNLLVWAVAFYIIENIHIDHVESSFLDNVLNAAIYVLSESNKNRDEYRCVMKGLQRLIVIKRNILEKIEKRIIKICLDGLRSENPMIAMYSMLLLSTQMYIECGEQVESKDKQTSPENLVPTIERFSALFEYIKRGNTFEVKIVCSLLPHLLDDFFTPADILTKVISEFLSSYQPHQKLLSRVIFHLFQNSIRQNQLPLLQDWVVFSLPNFTQNFSCPMATWCLTCFFISASRNKWLTCIFPYVQTRLQRYEHEDREMLCIAGLDFYRNLSTDKQKNTFKESFKDVKDMPEMPFNELLSCL